MAPATGPDEQPSAPPGGGRPDDPVLARRSVIARWVKVGQRVGYTALLVSIVAFVVAAATDFAGPSVAVTVTAIGIAILVLPVPIVLGYGLRAAEREERETGGRG